MPPPGDGTCLNTIERCGLEIRYLRVSSGPQRGKYVHQLVAEAMLGRSLMAFEEVDHMDGNTLNNHFTNLQVIHGSAHAKETRRRAVQKRREKRADA
jgi:hypothetical protein